MPDFNRLHDLSHKLAMGTAPAEQHPGLASWCLMIGGIWKEIAEMWDDDPKRAAAQTLYAALEALSEGQEEAYAVTTEDWTAKLKTARAALAKARGESTE